MIAVLNDIDRLFQAAESRYGEAYAPALRLSASAPAFVVALDATVTPSAIVFIASRVGVGVGQVTFSTDTDVPLSVDGDVATLLPAAMVGPSCTVTVKQTWNGQEYVDRQTVLKTLAFDASMPPAPGGLSTVGTLASIQLTWDAINSTNIGKVEVWRALGNDRATAIPVGETAGLGRGYTDNIGAAGAFYYWIRYVSKANIPGPFNAQDGTHGGTGTEAGHLLDLLKDRISESQLMQTLRDRIDAATGVGDVVIEQIEAETAARIAAIDKEIEDRMAAIRGEVAAREAYVQDYTYSKVESDHALAIQADEITANFTSYVGDAVGQAAAAAASAEVRNYAYSKAQADAAEAAQTDAITTSYRSYSDGKKDEALTAAAADVRSYSYSKSGTDDALASLADTLRSEMASSGSVTTGYVQEYAYSKAEIDAAQAGLSSTLTTSYKQYADGRKDEAISASAADVRNYSYSKAASDSALSETANQLRSEFQSLNEGAGATVAWVQQYAYSKAESNAAIASSNQQLSTTVNDHTTTLEIQAQSIDGLGGQIVNKIDNNGYVSGYGLASTPINGVPQSSFIVLADRFAVALPGQAAKYPFVIGTVAGQTVIGLRGDVVLDGTFTFRDITGKPMLGIGVPLDPSLAAPGTKNSDIVVGGRNLAEDSAFERRLRPWSQRSSAVSSLGIEGAVDGPKNLVLESNGGDAYVEGQGPYIPVVPGRQYMLSCEYASAGTIVNSSSYFYYSNGDAVNLPLINSANSGGVRVRFSMPWTCPEGVTGLSPRFGLRCNAYSWMRVYNFDVQEGNKAAPWSPAPEDLRADAHAKADAAANAATSAATTYAAAQAELARIKAQAYADGVVDAEEQRAINDATTKAENARVAAVNAAAADATAKAAVAATMADSSGLNVGLGGRNRLNNSLPNNASGYNPGFYGGSAGTWGYASPSDSNAYWSPERRGCVWMRASSWPPGAFVDWYSTDRPVVVPRQKYEAGVTLSVHRCVATVSITWLDVNGQYISETTGSAARENYWNADSGSAPPRSVAIGVAPDNARNCYIFVRMNQDGVNTADPAVFMSQFYFGDALPSQNVGSPYTPSSFELRDMAAAAQAGLDDKLSQTAGGVMGGPTIMQGMGAFVAGNAYYSSVGFGGTGTVMSPYGFACVQNGVPKLAMSVSGDIFYGGELRGAYGTFNVVRIANGGALVTGGFTEQYVWAPKGQGGFHLSGSGFIMGDYYNKKWIQITWDGNVYSERFRIVDGQVFMDGPTITTPDFGAKTVSGLYDSRGAEGLPINTTQVIGSYSVTMVGAVGAATAQFSFQTDSGKVTLSVSGNSVTVYGKSGNGRCQGTLFVTMTDSNGMGATGSCYIDAGFGNGVPI